MSDMADLKKAIETVQDMLDVLETAGSCYAYKHNGGDNRLRNVLDCLRAQQEAEKNDPLTLNELRWMDGEPVWCVALLHEKAEWAILHTVELSGEWFLSVSGASCGYGDKDIYGKTWLAYRRRPKEDI